MRRFLNVVILPYNTGRSFGGRSACMTCLAELRPHELVPLLSYFTLRGRCGSCGTKISIQYPLVELLSGLLFAGLYLKFQDLFFTSALTFAGTYAYYAVLLALLLVIAVYDLRHKIIPDSLAWVFAGLSFIGIFIFSFFSDF